MEDQQQPTTGLTDKQSRFIEEYCTDFNGAAACRRAGYSEATAKQEAYKLLRLPAIKQAIDERLEVLSMSAAEATKRLTDWGRGSFAPFMRSDETWGQVLDLTKPEAEENLHLLKKVKQTKRVYTRPDEASEIEYTTEIEIVDAKDAVVQIAKIRGLFIDKHEHSGNLNISNDPPSRIIIE